MPDSIWFEVPAEFEGMLTARADPALIALTIPAMGLGLPLRIEGPVDEELAFSYADVQALYSASGKWPAVSADFEDTVKASLPQVDGVAAGFSAGIDSYALLAEHHYADDVPAPLRLTHLLFNNVGSHSEGREQTWRRRYGQLQGIADRTGLPFIPVNSNLDRIPAPGYSYEPLNSPANASVAHLLAGGLRTWIFGSSVEYRRIGVTPNAYNSAFVDPIALPLMSTSALTLRLASSRRRRIDKVRVVAELTDAWESLDVCTSAQEHDKSNCSRCWKCQMTLGALDLIGAVDRFESQFDLEAWRRNRDQYLARVSFGTGPALVRELVELMDETNYKPTARARRAAGAQLAKETARSYAGRAKRRAQRIYQKIPNNPVSR